MKKSFCFILSFLMILGTVLIAVPAVNAINSAVYSMNAAGQSVNGYDSLTEALEDTDSTITWYQLNTNLDCQNVSKDILLDLNGYSLTNVTVPAGVTLTCIDTATDDYEGNFGILSGTVEGTIATTVKTSVEQIGAVKSYVAICDDGIYSFHRYYASIAAISLKPAQAALGYRAEFRGDEAVKNAVVGYGYELWVNNNAHKTYTRTDALESGSLTLRLKNILAEGNDALNALGSTATIGGNAYIALDLGGEQVTLQGTEQLTTLRQVVESINANVSAYGEAQLQSVRDMITTYASWMEGWATENIFGNGEGSEGGSGLDVEITVDVTAENNVMTQDTTMSDSNVSAQVPQGVLLDENTTQLVLTVSEKASSDSGVALTADQSILPLDVHIQGISTDNTAPVTVHLGAILPVGLNIGNYTLYHVENGEPVEMTYVDSVEQLDAHNEFFYEPATGDVTISVASFSEIALVSDDNKIWNGEIASSFSGGSGSANDPWLVANADQLAYMSQVISNDESYADDCYKLITDVNFGATENSEGEVSIAHVFYPIGYWKQQEGTNSAGEIYYGRGNSFQGVFDGNGNTVANLYQNTWQMDGNYNNGYWNSAMGLFGACFNATIKNLTIKNFQSDGEFTPTGCVAAYAGGEEMLFENIYLTNCNPRVYNTGNGGIVGLNYNSTSGAEDHIIFRNITVDQTNKISALWGSWDVACGGIMGRLRENSLHDNTQKNQVTFENCHVAAIIDVYNDVCANYQYYQYRYAGMMIGTVDYINQVDAFGLEDVVDAEKCTVTYGDWNEYWYCELVSNSLASYTHDHQFSRLVKISSIDEISNDNGQTWKEKGNFVIPSSDNQSAECFHIVEQDGLLVRHTHEMSGTEVINGNTIFKEDRSCYFIPFGQLFAGYGYPAHPVYTADGTMLDITITDLNSTTKSSQKFVRNTSTNITSYVPDTTIRVGDLFAENGIVDISNSTVQVFVSPADEYSTTAGVYTADTSDWKVGTLTISGTGKAKITITDYFYCEPTTITIEVRQRRVYYVYENDATYVDIETGYVTLPTADGVVGWTKTAIPEGSASAPEDMLTPGKSFHVEDDTTLYAVYNSNDRYYTADKYCPHLNTTSSITQNPTCSDTGTASVICNDCGDTVSSTSVPALGHTCEDGICIRCGGKYCGNDITWKLDEATGVLTLSGTGSTWLYKDIKRSPFIKYVDQVTSVVIGEGITRIEEYLFYDMKNIESVQFPSTATAVTNRAFACCTSLKEITIPTSLDVIGAYAFRASGVNSVTFESTSYPRIVSPLDPFKYCNYTVYAPCSESWQTSSINWGGSCNGKILTHSFIEGTTTCSICNKNYCGEQITWTFDEATGTLTLSGRGGTNDYYGKELPYADLTDKISTIVVGEGITELNRNIFIGLENVTSVKLPGSLQKIQARALADLTSLKELVIPANVTTLGALCIENCNQLNLYFLGCAPTTISTTPCKGGTYTLHIPCENDTWTQEKLDALGGTCAKVEKDIHNYVEGVCSVCGIEEAAA